jgi:hypothetical protein
MYYGTLLTIPNVWLYDNNITSSILGFKRKYRYEDLRKVSYPDWTVRGYVAIQLTFIDGNRIVFVPNKHGLSHLWTTLMKKTPDVEIRVPRIID